MKRLILVAALLCLAVPALAADYPWYSLENTSITGSAGYSFYSLPGDGNLPLAFDREFSASAQVTQKLTEHIYASGQGVYGFDNRLFTTRLFLTYVLKKGGN